MRASGVLKGQSIVVSAVLRSWFQAVTSATRVAPSAMRRSKHWPFSTLSSISTKRTQTRLIRHVLVVLLDCLWVRPSGVRRRGLIQGNAQMNLDGRPSDPHLFDPPADALLTLLKIEGIDAVANVPGEGFDFARQPVVGRQFLALCQERLAL